MMMRRGSVNGSDALDTINAAATVIASVENRLPQASVQKRRWGGCLNIYSCFGSQKNNKRFVHAIAPEVTFPRGNAHSSGEYQSQQQPSAAVPFIAPPSSPASFIPSEGPSAIQSPTGIFSLTSISANMYSPGGPTSIFATGPYADDTRLVSPPVFSTFTTEPSTAPFTPPPESIHLTTPSSPEVPFARVEPNLQNGEAGQRYPFFPYEFQTYHLQPGSPVSHLISPCSGISGSGTSSPFHERDFSSTHPFFLQFGVPPKLMDFDKILLREWELRQESGAVTPDANLLERQNSDISPLPHTRNGLQSNETIDHRVSFEITPEEVIRCVEKKPVALSAAVFENLEHLADSKTSENANGNNHYIRASENLSSDGEKRHRRQKSRTITLGSTKDFDFNTIDGVKTGETSIASDWWANEKVLGEEVEQSKKWSFFPMVETGVS